VLIRLIQDYLDYERLIYPDKEEEKYPDWIKDMTHAK